MTKNSVFRKGLVIGIIILFIGASVIPTTVGIIEKKTTITNSGSRGYIQDLIDNASDGDTIYIPSGTYYENIVIDKSINLIGEDKNSTVIDGGNSGNVVDISYTPRVNISGFTIKNSGYDWGNSCIKLLFTDNNTISDCIISGDYYFGIYLYYSKNNIIHGNIIIPGIPNPQNWDGIKLFHRSNSNIISDNIITNHMGGIQFTQVSNNIITDNQISENIYGIDFFMTPTNNNTITNNFIKNNSVGINLDWWIIQTNIDDNIICNNQYGIRLQRANYSAISGNNITDNSNIGISLEITNENKVYHNNIINNDLQARDYGSNNIWDDGYPSGGNYWDDYTGEDNDGDCIGDTPYPIVGGDNEDRYPFMNPSGWINQPPDKPTINGPTSGKPGVEYTYYAVTTDPNCDKLYYKWNWGDGSFSDWIGPYDSGVEIPASHVWSQGNYEIKAKAKDDKGTQSYWSDPLDISVPRGRITINSLFFSLFERFPNLFPILRQLLS